MLICKIESYRIPEQIDKLKPTRRVEMAETETASAAFAETSARFGRDRPGLVDQAGGRVMVKVEPRPGSLATATVPPWSSTNAFTSASPSPIPCRPNSKCPDRCRDTSNDVKNGSKTYGSRAASMPTPLSCTSRMQ